MEIPREILPEPKPSNGIMTMTTKNIFNGFEIPIAGVVGDQQSALFGQACFKPGMAKNTYGTALALMMNIGEKFILSKSGLTTDLSWGIDGKIEYSFEGLVFNGGGAVQWLRMDSRLLKMQHNRNHGSISSKY